MDSKKAEAKKELTGVAKLRERFYEIKRNVKASPALIEATRQRTPDEIRDLKDQAAKEKIARQKSREDLGL